MSFTLTFHDGTILTDFFSVKNDVLSVFSCIFAENKYDYIFDKYSNTLTK